MRPCVVPLLVAALALCACHTVGQGLGIEKGAELSYAQVQTIQPGLTAAQIRDAFGEPAGMDRGPDGKIRRMSYPTLDAKSNRARLNLEFDARETLVRKTFTGEEPRR